MAKSRHRSTKYRLPDELADGPKRRPARVADVIQSEVAMLLLSGIKDPRVEGVTLVGVRVTDDLRTARLLFTCIKANADHVLAGLTSARGYIRSHLAKELKLRYVPELIFEYDTSLDKQQEIEMVLQEIARENDNEPATSGDT